MAVWLMVRGRPTWSAVVLSLCMVTRYELLVFVPLWALALRHRRARWPAYPLLLWAPVAHNLFGVLVLPRWPIGFILGATHPDLYGSGTPLSMMVKSMATSGPVVAVLAVVGVVMPLSWMLSRRSRPSEWSPGLGNWLVPACYGLHLLAQTVIYWRGLFASGGYARFLVSTSPLAALCALTALNLILDGDQPLRRRLLWVVAIVVVLMWVGTELEANAADETWLFLIQPVRLLVRAMTVAVLIGIGWLQFRPGRPAGMSLAVLAIVVTALPLAYLVRPHRLPAHTRQVADAIKWLRTSPYAGAPVIATNIWVSHFLDRGHNVVPPDSTEILTGAAAGTVFVWDEEYSLSPRFDITADAMAQRTSWRLVWGGDGNGDDAPFVRIYLREADGG